MGMPKLVDYLDYRAYLRDYYSAKKALRGLSFRSFSQRAGLGSPNYLKLVMDGDRNLSDAMAARFAKALNLDADDSAYFGNLVRFCQAKGSEERAGLFGKLTGFQRYQQARPLDAAHADYHCQWYLPALRELAARADFSADPSWIARMLSPPISEQQAKEGLALLLRLGLLVREKSGRITQGELLVSTGAEVRTVHIASYHRMMLERAIQSIDGFTPDQRDISALTLCMGKGGLKRLKLRLQRFRRELLELSTEEKNPKQVVQVNLQLFPLSLDDDPLQKGKR
jgi:uncharacterized protein (TIGR02147 family)